MPDLIKYLVRPDGYGDQANIRFLEVFDPFEGSGSPPTSEKVLGWWKSLERDEGVSVEQRLEAMFYLSKLVQTENRALRIQGIDQPSQSIKQRLEALKDAKERRVMKWAWEIADWFE